MGMYGPHTDTFLRGECEDLVKRIRHLERFILEKGYEIPDYTTYSQERVVKSITDYMTVSE